ncbi:MAG TPA: hypothetical protein DEQ06_03265 [Porphyromonadaceae bacterium]|nr:hypothetical protein [Proteiniphilum sp.]HCC85612.1 hypothetical protein [Porphyromonadaceae bacterium]
MNLKEKSRIYFQRHWLRITGVAVGLLGGYLYYYYVGCVSGTCPITSNPYRMMLYGALMGYLLFDIFSKDSHRDKHTERVTNQNDNHTEQ